MSELYEKINQYEKYFGEVVDVDKTSRVGKIKIKVKTIFDEIPTEYIPWAYPNSFDNSEIDIPSIGELVWVEFRNSDIMFPEWYRTRTNNNLSNISDDDFPNSTILKEKDLSKYGLDGKLSVRYTPTNGLVLELLRNDNSSTIEIRHDNTIMAKNGNSGQILHMANDNISIGSENKSAQPATVGDDNLKALEMLNDTIKNMMETMSTYLNLLSQTAGASPYTKHLQAVFKKYQTQLEQTVNTDHSNNDSFFPETLSKCVTVDKEL